MEKRKKMEKKVKKISIKNFKELAFVYFDKKYSYRLQEYLNLYLKEFPEYDLFDKLDGELYIKNFVDWLIFEKILNEIGMTIFEEFIEKNNSNFDLGLVEKLKNFRNTIRGTFIVISIKNGKLLLKDIETKKRYTLIEYYDNTVIPGLEMVGRFHLFGVEEYIISGISNWREPVFLDFDVYSNQHEEYMIKEKEKLNIRTNSRLTTLLNKYPAQWINGICKRYALSASKKNEKVKLIGFHLQDNLSKIINELPKESKNVLRIILNKSGFVKYNRLKKFDDSISFWWEEKPPSSTIGILRLSGLVIIGKMLIGNRKYKIAYIPFEFQDKINNILNKTNI